MRALDLDRSIRWPLTTLFSSCLALAAAAVAVASTPWNRVEADGPYCGVYSTLASLNALGITVAPEFAIDKRYISSYRGSTGADLTRLAADCGAKATVMTGLHWEHLIEVDRPVILHFQSLSQLDSYDHWVAYLGQKDGKPVIYDPPERYEPLTWGELTSRWDGIGIMVSRQDSSAPELRYASAAILLKSVLIFGPIFLVAWGLAQFSSSPRKRYQGAPGFALLLLVTVALVGCVHLLSPVGLASSETALAHLARRHFPSTITEISEDGLQEMINSQSGRIFDARLERDFRNGSIPGALSLPVDSQLPYRMALLQSVEKDTPIVVFCQSSSCLFADQIARYLNDNKYLNVRIFRPGYRGWSHSQNR